MEDKNGYYIQSMKRIITVCNDYQDEVDANPALQTMFSTLLTLTDKADTLSLKLNTSTKTFTEVSDALREKSATDLSIAATVASSYGAANNIPELKALSRFTFTKLRKSSLANQLNDSKTIYELLKKFKTELLNSGIDTQMITDIGNDIAGIEEASAVPQKIIDQHKNDKTQLVNHLKNCTRFFDNELDKAMQLYKLKNLDFFLAYTAARKVRHHHQKRNLPPIDPETTTGILELLILDTTTTQPIEGAQLVVTAINLSVTTDEDGEIYADLIPPATYQAKLFMDGYTDLNFDFVIEAAKTCTKQLLMEKNLTTHTNLHKAN